MKFKKIQTLLYGMPLLLVAVASNGVSSSNELNQNVNLTSANNNTTKGTALSANTYNQMIPSYGAYLKSSPKIGIHNKLAPVYEGTELKQSTIWNSWFWNNNEAWSQYGNKPIAQEDWYWLYGATSNSGYVTTMKLYTGKKQEVFIVVTPAPEDMQNDAGTVGYYKDQYLISVAVFNEGGVDAPFLRAPIWTSSLSVNITGNTQDNYGFTFQDQGNFTYLLFSNSTSKIWDMSIPKVN